MQNILLTASSEDWPVDAIQEDGIQDTETQKDSNNIKGVAIGVSAFAVSWMISKFLLSIPKDTQIIVSDNSSKSKYTPAHKQFVHDALCWHSYRASCYWDVSDENELSSLKLPEYLLNGIYNDHTNIRKSLGKCILGEIEPTTEDQVNQFQGIIDCLKVKGRDFSTNKIILNRDVLIEEICLAINTDEDIIKQYHGTSDSMLLHDKSKDYIQQSADLFIYIINKAYDYKEASKDKKVAILKKFQHEIEIKRASILQAKFDNDLHAVKAIKNIRLEIFELIKEKIDPKQWRSDKLIAYLFDTQTFYLSYIMFMYYENIYNKDEISDEVLRNTLTEFFNDFCTSQSYFTAIVLADKRNMNDLQIRYELMRQAVFEEEQKDLDEQYEYIKKMNRFFSNGNNYNKNTELLVNNLIEQLCVKPIQASL